MTALIKETAMADTLPPRYAGVSPRTWQFVGLAVLLALAIALPFLVSNYRVFQFNMVLVYAIVLLGLNILTGFNGQISLGHGAFYAIGAYVAAILMDHFATIDLYVTVRQMARLPQFPLTLCSLCCAPHPYGCI